MSFIYITVLTAVSVILLLPTGTLNITEHMGFSKRTNILLVNPGYSVIRNHAEDENHIDMDFGFIITFRARHWSDVRIAESLCIFQDKPELN